MIEIKENDVYRFRFNEAELKKRFEPWHCFDGKLVVFKNREGELRLRDTYWSTGSSRAFTLDEVLKIGSIELICNADEVDPTDEFAYKYYEDDDIYDLSYQHRCCKRYALRRGAEKSKQKMLKTLYGKLSDTQHEIEFAERQLETINENIQKVEGGDLDVYI
jgi:hypothetical protein